MDLVVYGIPAAAIIVAIVQMVKRLFPQWSGRILVLVSLVTGVLLAVGVQLAFDYPSFDTWFRTVLGGLVVGLAASGLFDASLQEYPDHPESAYSDIPNRRDML